MWGPSFDLSLWNVVLGMYSPCRHGSVPVSRKLLALKYQFSDKQYKRTGSCVSEWGHIQPNKAILRSKEDGVSLIDMNEATEKSKSEQPKHKKAA